MEEFREFLKLDEATRERIILERLEELVEQGLVERIETSEGPKYRLALNPKRVHRLKDLYSESELRVEDLGKVVRLVFDPYRIIIASKPQFIKWLKEILLELGDDEAQ